MKFSSIGASFKGQLGELMAKLSQTAPHYIRCIKPNGSNRPALFENANVLHQLRCGGVLEARVWGLEPVLEPWTLNLKNLNPKP